MQKNENSNDERKRIAEENYKYQIADKKKGNRIIKTVAYYVDEEFKPFPGNPRFLISNKGTAYDTVTGYKLVPYADPNRSHGKHYFYYYLPGENHMNISAHRMEMLTFNPIPNPEEMQVNHIDANKQNNNLENLEWVTPQENVDHAVTNDLIPRGETSFFATHTEEEVIMICYWMSQGKMPMEIAEIMNIPYSEAFCNYISKLRTGECWRHITKNFTFPEPFKHTEEEVIMICDLLSKGKRPFEVVAIVENTLKRDLKENFVNAILYKQKQVDCWRYIIDKYKFPNLRAQLMTEEEIHQACKLMEQELTVYEILNIMGKEPTPSLIQLLRGISRGVKWRKIAKNYDVLGKLPYINTPITDETIHQICKLLEVGCTREEIAIAMNIPNTQAFAALIHRLRAGQYHTEITSQYNIPKVNTTGKPIKK